MTRLACLILGHRYWLVRKLFPGARKLRCARCRGEFATLGNKVVPWDQWCEDLYPEDAA